MTGVLNPKSLETTQVNLFFCMIFVVYLGLRDLSSGIIAVLFFSISFFVSGLLSSQKLGKQKKKKWCTSIVVARVMMLLRMF